MGDSTVQNDRTTYIQACSELPCEFTTNINGNDTPDKVKLDFVASEDGRDCAKRLYTVIDGGEPFLASAQRAWNNDFNNNDDSPAEACRAQFVQATMTRFGETPLAITEYFTDGFAKTEEGRQPKPREIKYGPEHYEEVKGIPLAEITFADYTIKEGDTLKSLADWMGLPVVGFAQLILRANEDKDIKWPVTQTQLGTLVATRLDNPWEPGVTVKIPVKNHDYSGPSSTSNPVVLQHRVPWMY